ncbi:hypothetical protein GOP47_0027913 [Adiantum capillus-veneris]|nr:hypothetical protein GOP47_0027913 [Adiantum capillus-veneris]
MSSYELRYGFEPEKWHDDWWLTPDMEMSEHLDILPVIFRETYLTSHLPVSVASSIIASLTVLCNVLPERVRLVFLLLQTVFSTVVEHFYMLYLPAGLDRRREMEMACNLFCISRTLARRIHLFNQSMTPLYLRIIRVGSSDPSNPSFLRLTYCLDNQCKALCRMLSLAETYASYAGSLARVGQLLAGAGQEVDAGVPMDEDGMEVEDEGNGIDIGEDEGLELDDDDDDDDDDDSDLDLSFRGHV